MTIDYTKLSMKERAELLPVPTNDSMEEFEQYKKRLGYDKESLRSVRYKMQVYDDFLKEYDYRKKSKEWIDQNRNRRRLKRTGIIADKMKSQIAEIIEVV